MGGCAAAMAAASLDRRVILTDPNDWLGGQLTSQAVPPDEHPWIEQFGCTARYRQWRDGVRQYYRDHYPLTAEARANRHLNPGDGRVSRLCHEPRVALAVIEQMLASDRGRGAIRVMHHPEPIAVDVDGDTVRAVTLRNTRSGDEVTVEADYFLDATELGDLLPLAAVEYVSGAESARDTAEPHAVDGPPQPDNVQAITWCFPIAFDPAADHTIDKPAQYDRWRQYVPDLSPPWTGPLLAPVDVMPITLQPRRLPLFPPPSAPTDPCWWHYRRIVSARHYPPKHQPHEVSLVNWPMNDFIEGNLIDQPPHQVAEYLASARQLSLSLLYWLQTEAPRPDSGVGFPGLHLRPDMTGTPDGLAEQPYIRESRRIRAQFTVTENHVGVDARNSDAAETFHDSVGIGYYRIDLHISTGQNNYIDIASHPFQIPLGALLPVRVNNLLPACKNIGTTHISNGCYRLHPVEWNIGEAAGLLAAFCIDRPVPPRAVRERADLLEAFQTLLVEQGIELQWPRAHTVVVQ
ncbi:MAG: FAD-dependent oxidoreductase [Planctomycetaceae bacterium]|nr:FAD-dependent oxidoreductase [Planctomycetaceae bacterium]